MVRNVEFKQEERELGLGLVKGQGLYVYALTRTNVSIKYHRCYSFYLVVTWICGRRTAFVRSLDLRAR